jgi:putative transposase
MEVIGNLSKIAKDIDEIVRLRMDIEKDLRCKFCNSRNVVRNGHSRDKEQRYLCKNCGGVFIDNESLPRMQISVQELGEIIGQYYRGMSLKEIREQLKQQHNLEPARSSIDRWLARFSAIAINEAKKSKPQVGDKWIADETVLQVNGKNVWFWDIIESKTRFLLASHISRSRTTRDAQILMEKASEIAGKAPKIVVTDGLRAYQDATERTWGSDTTHIIGSPFETSDDENTNLIERFHSTLKTRTEIMRGLKSLKTAEALLEGWRVHYNYFRSHESLDDKTPAEVAKAQFPFKDWLATIKYQSARYNPEIVKSTHSSRIHYKPKHRGKIRKRKSVNSAITVATTLRGG